MNSAIYLTLKKLNNPESVSKSELEKAANAVFANAVDNYTAVYLAVYAASDAAKDKPESAKYWVNKYFKETGESKQDYLNAIGEER